MANYGKTLKEFEIQTLKRMQDAKDEIFIASFLLYLIEDTNEPHAAIKRNEYRDRIFGYGVIRDLYKAQLDVYYDYTSPDPKNNTA